MRDASRAKERQRRVNAGRAAATVIRPSLYTRLPKLVGTSEGRKPAWCAGFRVFVRLCVVCLRASVGGGGDVAEAWWFGDAERVEEVALVGGQLGALGELAVG